MTNLQINQNKRPGIKNNIEKPIKFDAFYGVLKNILFTFVHKSGCYCQVTSCNFQTKSPEPANSKQRSLILGYLM